MEQTMNQDVSTSMMTGGAEKKGKGLVAGMVACAILAVGGIAFGAYGMIQNSQKDNQISDLKVQIEDSNGKITALETDEIKVSNDSQTITISDSVTKKQNPIISATAPKYYSLGISSPRYTVNGAEYYATLNIKDGDVVDCALYTHTTKFVGYDMVETNRFDRDCNGINGISGKIYKAVTIGEGQDASKNSVAFIMEDGTVEYVSGENMVTEIVNNGIANIKGTLSIDGFVIDAFTVDVGEDGAKAGGYATTIFVLSDGSYIKYDTSMLN